MDILRSFCIMILTLLFATSVGWFLGSFFQLRHLKNHVLYQWDLLKKQLLCLAAAKKDEKLSLLLQKPTDELLFDLRSVRDILASFDEEHSGKVAFMENRISSIRLTYNEKVSRYMEKGYHSTLNRLIFKVKKIDAL